MTITDNGTTSSITEDAALARSTIADATWDEATTGHTTAGTFGEQCKTDIDDILVDTNELQADWTNAGRLDAILDIIAADVVNIDGAAMRGTDSALLAASAPTNFGDLAITVTTGLVDVNDKTGFGIAVGGIASTAFAAGAVDAAAIAADAIGSSELATSAVNEIVDQVWNEARTDHTTQGSYGETMDTVVSANAITGTLSTTQMTTDLTEITDDHYNGRTIIWTSGVLIDQATNITDYDGGTKMLTFTAVTEGPSNTDDFIIV